ncbi:MAG: aspartate kinase, partial [Chloroflexota bacterium]
PELSYSEAAEVAMLGAEVLHPRTLAPLAELGIPLSIRNIARPDRPGTRVVARPEPTGHAARAIISAPGFSLVSVVAAGAITADSWTPDLAARALAGLAATRIEILSFSQSFTERSLTVAVRASDADFVRECLESIFEREREAGAVRPAFNAGQVALVAVISAPNGGTLVPRTFAALGEAGAHILTMSQGVDSFHISFILPESEVARVVQALHRELGLA